MIDPMFGFSGEKEKDLCFYGQGNYKGYHCQHLGSGYLIFTNGTNCIKASSKMSGNWVHDCWQEIKRQIDLS